VQNLIVVDNPKRWDLHIPGVELVSSRNYLTEPRFASLTRARVFNLCRSYRYQAFGYYVSLLAEARGHRPLPSIPTIQDLRLSPVIRVSSDELDDMIQHSLAPLRSDTFELSVYFGRNLAERYKRLSLAIFNRFPAPLLRAVFKHEKRWRLDSVRLIGAAEIPDDHRPFVVEQAQRYFDKPHRPARAKRTTKYDMAILYNKHEELPASNEKAISRFIKAADALDIRTEIISKEDYGRLAEFDALFIRETTNVNHHTFRFSRRATAEGMVVIDDPVSILRCNNKIYMSELLDRHSLPMPRTVIFSAETSGLVAERIGFPCVVKLPDSSFSAGVVKFDTQEAFDAAAPALFEQSELLLAQEFVPTEFDWRIGVLDKKPLYASKYFMARKHWQILQREGQKVHTGNCETIPVEDAPHNVVRAAVKACALIGDGLYGVDIKVLGGRPRIIEINDNPSIDAGYEDAVLKDELYNRIMRVFLERLETRRR
jgi:glutathione synthase/RimK-type ligase-like ATP-grasp enzyme